MISQQPKQIWEAALGELQLQVTRPSYMTWLDKTIGVSCGDGEFVVGTPNAFVAEMLEQRMYALISSTMEKVTRGRVDVRFEVLPKDQLLAGPVASTTNGAHTPLQESPSFPETPPASESRPPQPAVQRRPTLNPGYSFDAFVVGQSNELAHAAALAVADMPGTVYNPLAIHSAVGLGKTHILHAIGHRVQAAGLHAIYTTAEAFTNEFIKAIRDGRTEEFRNQYRNADVLLLDDLEFLIGKEQTQEGFFHTFNALHIARRQIVVTTDRPVEALTLLQDRVRSRLGGGLVVDIQPPDLETRLAILRAKVPQRSCDVPPEVLVYLAERFHDNVRSLEGSFNRVLAYGQLTSRPVSIELAREITATGSNGHSPQNLSPTKILECVASHFHVSAASLSGPNRSREVSLPRQISMYLLKEDSHLGPTAIGRILGGKDHSTVSKACTKLIDRIQHDDKLRQQVASIRSSLGTI